MRAAFLAVIGLAALTACGQKGPLVLPDQKHHKAAATRPPATPAPADPADGGPAPVAPAATAEQP